MSAGQHMMSHRGSRQLCGLKIHGELTHQWHQRLGYVHGPESCQRWTTVREDGCRKPRLDCTKTRHAWCGEEPGSCDDVTASRLCFRPMDSTGEALSESNGTLHRPTSVVKSRVGRLTTHRDCTCRRQPVDDGGQLCIVHGCKCVRRRHQVANLDSQDVTTL